MKINGKLSLRQAFRKKKLLTSRDGNGKGFRPLGDSLAGSSSVKIKIILLDALISLLGPEGRKDQAPKTSCARVFTTTKGDPTREREACVSGKQAVTRQDLPSWHVPP